jgi:hypothetical protein
LLSFFYVLAACCTNAVSGQQKIAHQNWSMRQFCYPPQSHAHIDLTFNRAVLSGICRLPANRVPYKPHCTSRKMCYQGLLGHPVACSSVLTFSLSMTSGQNDGDRDQFVPHRNFTT